MSNIVSTAPLNAPLQSLTQQLVSRHILDDKQISVLWSTGQLGQGNGRVKRQSWSGQSAVGVQVIDPVNSRLDDITQQNQNYLNENLAYLNRAINYDEFLKGGYTSKDIVALIKAANGAPITSNRDLLDVLESFIMIGSNAVNFKPDSLYSQNHQGIQAGQDFDRAALLYHEIKSPKSTVTVESFPQLRRDFLESLRNERAKLQIFYGDQAAIKDKGPIIYDGVLLNAKGRIFADLINDPSLIRVTFHRAQAKKPW